jgi:hypothetical protein
MDMAGATLLGGLGGTGRPLRLVPFEPDVFSDCVCGLMVASAVRGCCRSPGSRQMTARSAMGHQYQRA